MPLRSPLLLAGLWTAAAVLATGVGLLAVELVAGELGDPAGAPALDDGAVVDALASVAPTATLAPQGSPSASTGPRPSSSPAPRPPGTVRPSASSGAASGPLRTVTTKGGKVSARCVSGEPRLVLATPAEGYRIDDSSSSRVTFESSRDEIRVRLGCDAANRVTASVRTEERDDKPSPEPSESEHPSPEPSESEDD